MTTKNVTSWAGRDTPTIQRSPGDRLTTLAFGAITWPWLLRSLSGGSASARTALMARLGLPPAALPNLGSWKADAFLLTRLVDIIETDKPGQVVELGCGATSLVVSAALKRAGYGRLTGYDQYPDYVAETRAWLAEQGLVAQLICAPLAPATTGWPGQWYQLSNIPDVIDLLVIDGPPWALHPLGRGSAECLFDRVPVGGSVVLDDAARPGERIVARRWAKNWPGFAFEYDGRGSKGTLIGRRLR